MLRLPTATRRCSLSLHKPAPYRAFTQSLVLSSGHNKWSKIKQKKAVEDAHKGALYARAARDIAVAVRVGGSGDPELNTALAVALKKYKAMGVPKDNIEGALAKTTGAKAAGSQNTTYEAMAGRTVGVIIECMTDNPSRTIAAIRDILKKHGARIAPVGFLFNQRGFIQVVIPESDAMREHASELMMAAVDAGAEDFNESEGTDDSNAIVAEIWCNPEKLHAVTKSIAGLALPVDIQNCEVVYEPSEQAELTVDEEIRSKVAALVEVLDGHEDTLRVWTTLK